MRPSATWPASERNPAPAAAILRGSAMSRPNKKSFVCSSFFCERVSGDQYAHVNLCIDVRIECSPSSNGLEEKGHILCLRSRTRCGGMSGLIGAATSASHMYAMTNQSWCRRSSAPLHVLRLVAVDTAAKSTTKQRVNSPCKAVKQFWSKHISRHISPKILCL